MSITRAAATLQAATNAIRARIDLGAAGGTFKCYAGGVGGTLIATCTCATTSHSAASSDGDAELASSATGTAVAAGNMNAFVLADSDGNEVERGTIGTTGADINFATGVHREIGEDVTITSYIINACKAVTP